jgi:hypothetical protein
MKSLRACLQTTRRESAHPSFTLRQAQGERVRLCSGWIFSVRAEPVEARFRQGQGRLVVCRHPLSTFLLLAFTLVACTSRDSTDAERHVDGTTAPAPGRGNSSEQQYLAYEHAVTVDIDEAALKPIYEKIHATCNTDKEIDCTVLDASITTDSYLSAKLRLRTKPEGVKKLIALVSASGRVSSQSTHVEDIAKPITDVAKRLTMLRDYQAKLLELQGKPTDDIDSLIKIVEKLAAVQADLERASGESAHLLTRVNLEMLNVSLSTRASLLFWAPIANSLGEFPGHLSRGMAAAIVGVAYVLPWLLVTLIGIVPIRAVWRRLRRQ